MTFLWATTVMATLLFTGTLMAHKGFVFSKKHTDTLFKHTHTHTHTLDTKLNAITLLKEEEEKAQQRPLEFTHKFWWFVSLWLLIVMFLKISCDIPERFYLIKSHTGVEKVPKKDLLVTSRKNEWRKTWPSSQVLKDCVGPWLRLKIVKKERRMKM